MIEVCCRISSTVEDGALSLSLRIRTRPFAEYQDSVMGARIEVYIIRSCRKGLRKATNRLCCCSVAINLRGYGGLRRPHAEALSYGLN